MASSQPSTPALSRSSSRSSTKSARKSSPLRLDLSDLPPLITPSPPSNTLLITNLQEPEIFHITNLTHLRDIINQTATIHTWAPLKSFRRIVVSFFDTNSAISIKQQMDGTTVMGCRVRVYFGKPTPITPLKDQHLQAPKSDKLFFISPPPSPPHGWEMRNEGPPNKEVHAEDLAAALAKLHARAHAEPISPVDDMQLDGDRKAGAQRRQRSGSSTYVYCPEDHGDSPDLPAIAVEDMTTESPAELSPMEGIEGKFVHTARPPVELMEH